MGCSPCLSLFLKFVLSVALFIAFIPGTLFKLPENEPDTFWGNTRVNVLHATLFIIFYYLFDKAACINTSCKFKAQ